MKKGVPSQCPVTLTLGRLLSSQKRVIQPTFELGVLGMKREPIQATIVVVNWVGGMTHRELGHLTADLADVRPSSMVVPQPVPSKQ